MEILFFFSLFFILYTYLGYPFILAVITSPPRTTPSSPAGEPSVSLLIPVYNEEEVIVRKLENSLALDYPANRLEIVVASDGSTDRTAELVRPFASRSVRLADFPDHRGKMGVINRTVGSLSGEIIVFTDASAFFSPDALRHLVAGFADPAAGAISGALVLKEEAVAGGELAVDWYWRMEKFIRQRESRLYSALGATGAIYALRRELFSPLPEDTILDDMLIPLLPVRSGWRIRFAGRARAYEERYSDLRAEFRRKVRTLVGNYQAFARAPWVFNPLRSRIAFQMISHKLFRLLVPFALLGLLASTLGGAPVLRPLFWLQAVFYGLAAVGRLLIRRRSPARVFSLPLTFCLLNAAALKAFWVYFFGRADPSWR